MREIKFRAWSYDDEVMITDLNSPSLFHGILAPFNDDVLMQFTGLQDSKGVDIYEDDIIQSSRTGLHYQVSWNNDKAAWTGLCTESDKDFSLGAYSWGDNSVIGNIYENPDLLNPS